MTAGQRDAQAVATAVRAQLQPLADAERAPKQQAYMKSEMPFLGVPVPTVRRVAAAAAHGVADAAVLRAAALQLWDSAAHREERYAAMALLGRSPNRGDPELVPLVEHMVRTGQWWDITDELAHRMADQLDARPDETGALLRVWARDANMWIRRSAVIAQLGRKDRLDKELLVDVILPNADDPEFFIRKAIGWALREHARVDPGWVREFVAATRLSPLSAREAMKHLA